MEMEGASRPWGLTGLDGGGKGRVCEILVIGNQGSCGPSFAVNTQFGKPLAHHDI